jgi:hypothetical protein
MRRLPIMVFFAAALGIAAAANYLLFANPPATEPLAPVNPVTLGAAAADSSAEELPASELLLVHTQTRPLFSPTRRKWVEPAQPARVEPEAAAALVPEAPPAAPEPAAAETPPPSVTLIGIEKTPLGARALLLKTGTADALWFESGEKLEGWAVQAIDAGSVEMALGARTIKLELYPSLPAPGLDP